MNKKEQGGRRSIFRWISNNKLMTIGILIVLIYVTAAVFAPVIIPFADVGKPDPSVSLTKPFTNMHYIFGTDQIGRNLLGRIIYGIRTSLIIGVSSVFLAALFGVMVGILAGFSSGILDSVLMRIVDVQMGFPFIVLAIIVLSLVQPDDFTVMIVLGLSLWPAYARAAKSSVILQKDTEYIVAARMMGASKLRIYLKYIGKNLLPAVVPLMPLDIAGMIINESLLSYMQIGIKPPTISIGTIMADAWNYMTTNGWLMIIPGITLLIVILGFNLIGDSLQIKFDPKLQK